MKFLINYIKIHANSTGVLKNFYAKNLTLQSFVLFVFKIVGNEHESK